MADRDDEHVDRISDLPTNVIDSILQLLPIEDVVKTSVLSREWRYMWSSTPRLEFGRYFFEKLNSLGYCNLQTSSIITEALRRHRGPINEFVVIPPSPSLVKLEGLTEWILSLSKKRVNRIQLVNPEIPYPMPPTHIFSCRDLIYLRLEHFRFSVSPTFRGFPRMMVFHFFDILFDSGALESLISGCPSLVTLRLVYCLGFKHIDVSAPSLKFLHIEDKKVLKSFRVKEPQHLIIIKLFADGTLNNIDGAWVADLLGDSPNIKVLCLKTSYIKILSRMYQHVQQRAIYHLDMDGLDFNEKKELSFLIRLLQGNASNLETLIIKCNSMAVEELQGISKEFDNCSCYFNQLQDLKITVKTCHKTALCLIRFVLARSPALKILTFRVDLNLSDASASCIKDDLSQMCRASPRAEIKFLYDHLSE